MTLRAALVALAVMLAAPAALHGPTGTQATDSRYPGGFVPSVRLDPSQVEDMRHD